MSNENNVVYRQLELLPTLARIKKLQYDRRYRDSKKLFFAEGIRNFATAVDNHFSIDTIIYSEKLLISPITRKMVRQLKRNGVPFLRTTPEQFRTLSQTEKASGIAAIFKQHIKNLAQINPRSNICWTVLSHIRSLGNLGTLIRTSAAVNAGGFILIGDDIDPFDPNVIRPTMGALFKQKFVRTNAEHFYKWVKSNKLQVVGASPNGSINYHKASYNLPTMIMLGNERKGLSSKEQLICDQLVKIPMVEGTDSLNVAVAGSLLLYEVFRSSQTT